MEPGGPDLTSNQAARANPHPTRLGPEGPDLNTAHTDSATSFSTEPAKSAQGDPPSPAPPPPSRTQPLLGAQRVQALPQPTLPLLTPQPQHGPGIPAVAPQPSRALLA